MIKEARATDSHVIRGTHTHYVVAAVLAPVFLPPPLFFFFLLRWDRINRETYSEFNTDANPLPRV